MSTRRPCLFFVIGTRPEVIKLAPVIHECLRRPQYEVVICCTGQHQRLLSPLLSFFNLSVTEFLELPSNQDCLTQRCSDLLQALNKPLQEYQPDLVIVQGDTISAFTGALAASYHQLPVAHIEAGYRSFSTRSPFPEESHRRLIAPLADLHFAPSETEAVHLRAEGIQSGVHVVGNTVIDALHYTQSSLDQGHSDRLSEKGVSETDPIILVTTHRREHYGQAFQNIAQALTQIAQSHPQVQVVFPVHPNPAVHALMTQSLADLPSILLLEPLDYPDMLALMGRSHLILTDSGGIQEEAAYLKKPVLILRSHTERHALIDLGLAKLIGTDPDHICHHVTQLLNDDSLYTQMTQAATPYGNGTSAQQILAHIDDTFGASTSSKMETTNQSRLC
ncbi:MAG: UDP-N-acetylglucosamine 2-epimerase (non-hydrolyzing) [Actinobacteria bacterium]|nr:UDP-N-acetylglucosamine 2-epimerase (non-hydrolyzing) [Actinomycetota bacterium]